MASKAELALILSLVDDVSKTAKGVRGQLEDIGKSGAGVDSGLAKLGANIGKFALGAVAAIAVVGTAIVTGIGAAAWKAGQEMDEAYDNLLAKTGAMGPALEGLKGSFANVFGNFPADAQTVSDVIAELNQRTGMTGPDLERLSTGILSLSKLTKTDASQNITDFTRVMGDWGVSNDDAQVTLDQLFKTTQLTGVGINDLMTNVVQFGAPMRLMGFTIEDSMLLFGKWAKEGVNAETVMGSLRIAAGKFAKAGKPLRDSLLATFKSIQDSTDASAALAEGMAIFGAKAGPDMVSAIREGRFNIEDLTSALDDSTDALEYTMAANEDFGEKLTKMKNKVTIALGPIGMAMMDVVGKLLDNLMPAFEKVTGFITNKVVPAIAPLLASLGTLGSLLSGKGGTFGPLIDFFTALGMDNEKANAWATALYGIAGGIGQIIQGDAPTMWASLGVPQWVIDGVTTIKNTFSNLAGFVKLAIAGLAGENVWKDFAPTFDLAGNFIQGAPGLESQLNAVGAQLLGYIVDGMVAAVNLVTNLASMFNTWANSDSVKAGAAAFGLSLGTDMANLISSALNNDANTSTMGQGILSSLITAVGDIADGILVVGATVAGGLIEGMLGNLLPKTSEGINTWLAYFSTTLVNAIRGMYPGGVFGLISDTLTGYRPSGGYSEHANGFEGMINKPHLFLAGEAGPEYVSITPSGKQGGGGNITHQWFIKSTDPKKAADEVMIKLRAAGMA